MQIDIEKTLSEKTDEQLQAYLDNPARYSSEAVEIAIAEFQKRGRFFSDEELLILRDKLTEVHEERLEIEKKNWSNPLRQWKQNVTNDIDAPFFYSHRAIYFLSILFGILTGSILLAINLNKIKKITGVWQVIIFGILFTIVEVSLLSKIPNSNGLTLCCNIGGAYILNVFFWNRFIGKNVKYRARPIWIPLIICIVITIPILLAIIYAS
jgi:hypothetical protein